MISSHVLQREDNYDIFTCTCDVNNDVICATGLDLLIIERTHDIFYMIETVSKIARKYSVTFGSLRRIHFQKSSKIFRKCLEIFGKSLFNFVILGGAYFTEGLIIRSNFAFQNGLGSVKH